MFAVAEVGNFFTKVVGKELLLEVEDDLLCVPDTSDQGVHALQGMLANSILHENSTRHDPSDLNQALRALEGGAQRLSDLFSDEIISDEALFTQGATLDISDDTKFRPRPFLDQGMLSYYMHSEDGEENKSIFPMSHLIQDDELAPVPNTSAIH
ncbi:hypothetical protein [Kiloniella sp.]|uniref:hypothetical protein n=1 Tax=Kiloniella sp. TaxID=1938587 RepID=UPI003B012FEB